MKLLFVLSALGFVATTAISQDYKYVYRNSADSTINCYLKIIPATQKFTGLIIRDYSSLPDTAKTSPYKFTALAVEKGFLVAYTVTSKRFPALYYFDDAPAMLDSIINEIVTEHKIPENNIFIGGISAGGTRALRFTQYCNEGKSNFNTKIKGVFVVDSPLDLQRFYESAGRNKNKFKKGMLWEANLIMDAFPRYLGLPDKNPEVYKKSSVHSYTDTTLGNAAFFLKTSIIFFHEPDIDWWINERGSSYFDINSFDIAGFVTKLRAYGNKEIELVTTTNKGFDREGNRNCHSWTIVDEEYLVKWILKYTH